jgi:hypothetical protein
MSWLSLGCHPSPTWTLADEGDSGRPSADAPQTVLKTAGLVSANVHQHPPTFDRQLWQSVIVHRCPQPSIGLAVFLAVTHTTHRRARLGRLGRWCRCQRLFPGEYLRQL